MTASAQSVKHWLRDAQLLLAIQYSDVMKAWQLFQDGVDTDIKFWINSHTIPAICLCVANNDVSMVQMMLQLGASPNRADSEGKTPLHMACEYGYLALSRLLLESNAEVCSKNQIGQTPLHLATKTGKKELVQLLISYGANLNVPDNAGQTPLHIAAQVMDSCVIRCLLAAGANAQVVDRRGNTPLHFAVDSLGTDTEGITALSIHFPWATVLPNCQKKTPLHIVVSSGRRDCEKALRVILRNGPFYKLSSPMIALSPRSERGHTPIHLAVLERNVPLVRILVAAGSQVDTRDQLGRTPLECAVRDNEMGIVSVLLAAGATTRRLVNKDGVQPHVRDELIRDMLQEATVRPLALTSLCRRIITITRGPAFQDNLDQMPKILRGFLAYEEL